MGRFGDSIPVEFSQGLTDNPNVTTLQGGELATAKGAEYRLGDPIIHKALGRSANTSSGLGAAVMGLKRFQYNKASDVMVAVAGGDIYESTPSTSMTFTNKMLAEKQSLGSGLDDMSVGGDYTDTVYAWFEIEIDAAGTPDTFKWRKNRGSYTTGVAITGAAQTLSDGVTITFAATTGHTLADRWTVTAIPSFTTTKAPSFTSFRDTWMMTVDSRPFVREYANVPSTNSPWRPAGLLKPGGKPTVALRTSAGSATSPDDAGTGDMVNSSASIDGDLSTSGYLTVNDTDTSDTHSWTFSTNPSGTTRQIEIVHGSDTRSYSGIPPKLSFPVYGEAPDRFQRDYGDDGSIAAQYKIEYQFGSEGWITLYDQTQAGYSKRTDIIALADGRDLSSTNLVVKATLTRTRGDGAASMQVYNLKVHTGRTTALNLENALWYGVTDVYVDSNGVEHESDMALSDVVLPTAVDTDYYGATITLSSVGTENPHAKLRRIYRSISEGLGDGTEAGTSGGYPDMYQIAEVDIDSTSAIDAWDLSLTSVFDKMRQYYFQRVIFPDGAESALAMGGAPPEAEVVGTFQGSTWYISSDTQQKDKLIFSEAFAIGAASGEMVPNEYFLRFATEQQDDLITAVPCNGGKSLICYFSSAASLVNYLPQASDPGRYDQRAKEFISKKRGVAGKLAATSFSPDEGVTEFAAAVDEIGLWITDGIGMLKNWSKDIDWDTHFTSSTDLTDSVLVDNPLKRRLEFYYDSDGAGAWKRFFIFYGELKKNGQPKWTGPDDALIRSVEWAKVSNRWVGYEGSSAAAGHVFNANTGVVDAAQSNGSNTSIDFDVITRDMLPYQLKGAALIQFLALLWDNPSTSKTVSVTVTTTTENGQTSRTATRTYNVKNSNTMMIHKFGDRFKIRIRDNSATALPGLVGGEVTSRRLSGQGDDTPATV